jgi:hypothetical protein
MLGNGNWIAIEIANWIGMDYWNKPAVFVASKETFQKGAAYHHAAPILTSIVSPRSWTYRYVVEMRLVCDAVLNKLHSRAFFLNRSQELSAGLNTLSSLNMWTCKTRELRFHLKRKKRRIYFASQ